MIASWIRHPLRGLWVSTLVVTTLIHTLASSTVSFGQQQPDIVSPRLSEYPILFTTHVPVTNAFFSAWGTIGTHTTVSEKAPRGGSLMIRYPDGTTKDLTLAAGYGETGVYQGANGIAVRDPSVHFSGKKALFSMVVGSPEGYCPSCEFRWQIYEVKRLGKNETPIIRRIPDQPLDYNNINPIYGPDGSYIFVSDRPKNGLDLIYPQLDEYELVVSNTGLWKLDPKTRKLTHMEHSPSGSFTPILDSYGRIIFTRWDHMNQDTENFPGHSRGAFDYSNEYTNDVRNDPGIEQWPEPAIGAHEPPDNMFNLMEFERFVLWQINPDGTGMLTLNHLGRHELNGFIRGNLKTNNPGGHVRDFVASQSGRTNPNSIRNFMQGRESVLNKGYYLGVDSEPFGTYGGGQIIGMYAPPSANPDDIVVDYHNHPDAAHIDDTPSPNHPGFFKNPLVLTNGTGIAAWGGETTEYDENISGSSTVIQSMYDYRLVTLKHNASGYVVHDQFVNTPIVREIEFHADNGALMSYFGPLWELSPVEVRPLNLPPTLGSEIPDIERQIFEDEGVDLEEFKEFMRENKLALLVQRNVTRRDDIDTQQPFNLQVSGGGARSTAGNIPDSEVFQIHSLQYINGMNIRGYNNYGPGRRVIGRRMASPTARAENVPNPDGPPGSVRIASDGSAAGFVPANRATSWGITDESGQVILRERYWLSFQPGEITVCATCHGLNKQSQTGQFLPQNPPEALVELLQYWKANHQ